MSDYKSVTTVDVQLYPWQTPGHEIFPFYVFFWRWTGCRIDEGLAPRGRGSCSAPGARVFKKARRSATKTTLRLKNGLDNKEVPSSPDKSVYGSNEKEIDDKEIDNDVNDNVNDKEINDDVNEDDDAWLDWRSFDDVEVDIRDDLITSDQFPELIIVLALPELSESV